VLLGLLAVVMMRSWANSREQELLQLADLRVVHVASRNISPNTLLDEQLILKKQVPATYVEPRAVTEFNDLRGRVAIVPIPEGAQILGTYLEDAGKITLSYEVPRGKRAITIAVNDVTGVAGLVRPGNFVDIFGTFSFGRPTGFQGGQVTFAEEKTEVRLMMQDVQIVAVDRDHRRDRPSARRFVSEEAEAERAAQEQVEYEERRAASAQSVTVIVGPQQAQELVLAQEIGTLTLSLRSNLDAGSVTDLGFLDALGLLKVQIPVKPRARPSWREIRGGAIGF
jgi:pilus assembly protein CpaB